MLKVNHVEDTRPVKSITLTQPKGTLDLTFVKNAAGNRVRISNADGNTINVALTEVASFKEALDKIVKSGAKTTTKAA